MFRNIFPDKLNRLVYNRGPVEFNPESAKTQPEAASTHVEDPVAAAKQRAEQVKAAGRKEAAEWGQRLGKMVRAEVRSERINNQPINNQEIAAIIRAVGAESFSPGGKAVITVNETWQQFDDLNALVADINSIPALGVGRVNLNRLPEQAIANPKGIAVSQDVGGFRVFARNLGPEKGLRYYLIPPADSVTRGGKPGNS